MPQEIDWTPEQVAQLKADWGTGLTCTEIARKLKISKSAVVGKAHRLKLAPRGNPVIPIGEAGRAMVIELWWRDCTISEIGARTGISRNGVERIAGLADLSRGQGWRPTLPPLGRDDVVVPSPDSLALAARISPAKKVEEKRHARQGAAIISGPTLPPMGVPAETAPMPRSVVRAQPLLRPSKRCEWLDGNDPKSYRRCDAPSANGSWCEEHYRRCFVSIEKRMSAA